MTEEYEKAVKAVVAVKDNEYLDFHARRLVEMAGHIIMGYLLLLDTERDDKFRNSTEIYIQMGRAENRARAEFIANSSLDDLGQFKQVQESV
ncbi:Acyl-CoA dehydrogenase C-terminal domain-containing protein [Marinilabilia salmonicolor]|nr:Acyl-CoA dehydrogenase C-terminal domain-containing protein [Marinilabilia salmonicolor]